MDQRSSDRKGSTFATTASMMDGDPNASVQDAKAQEQNLNFLEALKIHRRGVFWSFVLSTAIIMEGYDTKLMGTLFAQPVFTQHYGVKQKDGSYQIPAPWQAGLGNGSVIGQLIGLLLGGHISEKFGFRRSMMGGMAVIMAFIPILVFAPTLAVLEVGQVLFGIPLGMFQTTCVVYAFEITPTSLRAYLTNYVHLCWAFGQILATGVLRGMLSRKDQWAFRLPFALQWVWPVILIPAVYFAPESPWWHVRVGQIDEAKQVVKYLTTARHTDIDIDKTITLMIATTEHERMINSQTSYKACFTGVNLRRTIISIGIYCVQTFNGNPIRGYSTYFLRQAGLPTTQAFNMTIVGFAVAILGGIFSWVLLPIAGRRRIYLISLSVMFTLMVIIGALGVPQAIHPKSTVSWGIGSTLIVSSFVYYSSIGPLTNTLCAEIPSVLLRSKSIALARWTYALTGIVAGVLTPYQLNPSAWHWGARTAFFYAGTCFLCIVFAFFMVPETKNRTTAEMDILFERKIAARRFAKTQVDITDIVQGPGEEKSENEVRVEQTV